MKTVLISFFLIISLANCSCSHIKLHPEYKGVDPKVQGLVNEYKELAKEHGIVFNKEVTIGFKNLSYGSSSGLTKKISDADSDNIIGMCLHELGWREIDISKKYWDGASSISQETLIKHELTHCYCDRNHDYQGKIPYPDTYAKRQVELMEMIHEQKPLPGYYEDLCPRSIMYPKILEDYCVLRHYEDYIEEMFTDCEAW